MAFREVAADRTGVMVTRLVEALLSADADDRLDPLRVTLGLDGRAFRDGVFSWKGFIHYKWRLAETAPMLARVLPQVDEVALAGRIDARTRERIGLLRQAVKQRIRAAVQMSGTIMSLYDGALPDRVGRAHACAFRRFRLEAPELFVDLGHLAGVIAHIATFWSYRFADPDCLEMEGGAFADLLAEFENALTQERAR